MTRTDRIALLISFVAVLAAYLVTDRVFERMAHIEDEMAYVWQAQAISRGYLTLPSPALPKSFLVPFVVDYNGQRFGKYPLGWPVVLALGERLGVPYLVNPVLAGLGVWLTYQLGKRLFGGTVALLAADLTVSSPFFLLNSGSLLNHPLGLVLTIIFALGWLDAFHTPGISKRWLPALAAGAALGLLALTRPLTAVCAGLPFAIHGLILLVRGDWTARRNLILFGLTALAISLLLFGWQYAVTGDPTLNPYTLWWSYDKVGFGPGHGHLPGGHTLEQAWINTKFNIYVGKLDLFGWASYSWIFLPFGLLAILRDRNWRALLPVGIFISLFFIYMAYWIGAWLFGPRYYYEGLVSLALLSAAGIAWLAGWPTRPDQRFPNYSGWRKAQPLAITALLALLVTTNLVLYLPGRLQLMHGLYGVSRVHEEPFLASNAKELTPALIVVHTSNSWIEYGTLIDLENPFLDSPFIFVISRGLEVDEAVASQFPDRKVYHYYPADQPYTFYTAPRWLQ
jgi:4-amino-4-deoxy-L-arabinose transferase-like glycosyltransferase